MKFFTLLVPATAAAMFFPSSAQAARVEKLAGTYRGDGVVVDKRPSPSKYRYTFKPLALKVDAAGTITGTATLAIAVSFEGGEYVSVGSHATSVTGKVRKFKATSSRLTGTGRLTFANGITLAGGFDVAAKTGRGTFTVKKSTADADVKVTVTKKK